MQSNPPEIVSKILNESEVMKSWVTARMNGNISQFGIAGGDEIDSFKLGLLRFGSQLPAVCYAYGISLETLQQNFPEIFSAENHYDQVKGPSWPTYENLVLKNYNSIDKEILEEILDQSRWDWHNVEKMEKDFYEGHYNQYFPNYTIHDQIHFINKHCQRRPKKVLDIGGGRGEIANLFKKLGVDCVSVEPGQYSDLLYDYTGKLFFGDEFASASPTCMDLKTLQTEIEIDHFDTIIFCESIEHISESEFWNFWEKVKSKFSGLVIIINWIFYHPIPILFPEHIFEINDQVYDRLVIDSKKSIYRNHSHLVLQL